ncbi:hypothetical protein PG993_009193 [Apiospora rasikravindrae]|uniref:Aldos-2-ulose dehydratase beta-propeller domain-containing protein n=1 Tax=Apiospora rasikravindrae TaxID=990691 RepID=A0ABR1SIP2_9PEZI
MKVPTQLPEEASSSTSGVSQPSFGSAVIQSGRKDGYWVETFKFSNDDRVPGVMVSGLVSGQIEFLDNPIAEADHKKKTTGVEQTGGGPDIEKGWTKYLIGDYTDRSPVALVAHDITGDGLNDIILCCDYGPFMLECNPKGGHIVWLENPGRDKLKDGGLWKEHYVGRWPAMHRVKVGHFTQKSFLEIIAASVVYGPHDKTTPIPILRFQQPHKVAEATEWPCEVIDDENFTVIHELTPRKLDGPDGLDSLIVSSREGTTILSFCQKRRVWDRKLVGMGEPKEPWQTPDSESPGSGDHWGAGACDIGRVGSDPYAYIATMDPFHGNTVAVYTKVQQKLNGDIQWKRHCLDVYG